MSPISCIGRGTEGGADVAGLMSQLYDTSPRGSVESRQIQPARRFRGTQEGDEDREDTLLITRKGNKNK